MDQYIEDEYYDDNSDGEIFIDYDELLIESINDLIYYCEKFNLPILNKNHDTIKNNFFNICQFLEREESDGIF